MSKLKVLFLTSSPSCKGGIASVFRTISLELKKKNIDVFYTYDGGNNFFEYLFKYIRFLFLLTRYKIIHLNTPLSKGSAVRDLPYVILCFLFRRKLIVHFHGGDEAFFNQIKNSKIYKFILSKTFFKADKIIVLGSAFIGLYSIIAKVKAENWMVVPNPVDDIYFKQNNVKKIINKSNINILYLSRIDQRKGCEIAIKAFSMLQREKLINNMNLVLNICGDGPLLKEMKKLVEVESVQNVKFHGYVKDFQKQEQFLNNDIFLFPTYYGEGLPVSILEAMAFGLPIISRPVAGIPDWVKENINGFLVETKNPKDFKDVILKLLKSPSNYSLISKKNIRLAKDNFMPKNIVNKYITIYDSI